jgi:hypothetical protein
MQGSRVWRLLVLSGSLLGLLGAIIGQFLGPREHVLSLAEFRLFCLLLLALLVATSMGLGLGVGSWSTQVEARTRTNAIFLVYGALMDAALLFFWWGFCK